MMNGSSSKSKSRHIMTNAPTASPLITEALAHPDLQIGIVSIKANVQCHTCGHTWGIHLTREGRLPTHWNVCLECANRRKAQSRERFIEQFRDMEQ